MKYVIAGLVGFGVFIWLIAFVGWFPNYSEGERTGDVFRFSKKGLIWKSWEGTMYLGGITSGTSGVQMEKFYFSIPESQESEKSALIEKIKECSRHRETKCTIKYKQWLKSPISIESNYVVIGVN